jgi:hypothetical protein
MRTRGLLAVIGAGVLALAGLVAGAAPAQAGSGTVYDVTIDCTSDVTLPGGPGDWYNITMVGDCLDPSYETWLWNAYYFDIDSGYSTGAGFLGEPANLTSLPYYDTCDDFCGDADPSDWYYYTGPTPVTALSVQLLAVNQVGESLRAGPVAEVWAAVPQRYVRLLWGVSSAGPTEYWQLAYGRASAEATCDAGWSASWQQWPNAGAGGWVCVKDVVKYGS